MFEDYAKISDFYYISVSGFLNFCFSIFNIVPNTIFVSSDNAEKTMEMPWHKVRP